MTMPTTEEMLARLHEAQRASAYVQENYEHLMQKYPNQSIAVHIDKVVAVGTDSQQLTEHILAAGFDPAEVWTFLIPAEPRQILL